MSFMTITDIEYIGISILLLALFGTGLRPVRKESNIRKGKVPLISVDLNMSIAMKGIACVLVLMGHYATLCLPADLPWGISKIFKLFTANIALFWFMFFSGYGLSLKTNNNFSPNEIVHKWGNRIKKIYIPLLITCIITTLLYFVFPFKEGLTGGFENVHNLNQEAILPTIKNTLGLWDWYVLCIFFFYTFFYLSSFIERRCHVNQTIILWGLLAVYLIVAIPVCGYSLAHYYRYCWAFFCGHIVARWNVLPNRLLALIGCCLLAVSLLFEDSIASSVRFFVAYGIALVIIYFMALINCKYEMRGKMILFLGEVSYFYYLAHIRIGYFALSYFNMSDLVVWTVISFLVATLLTVSYNRFVPKVKQ